MQAGILYEYEWRDTDDGSTAPPLSESSGYVHTIYIKSKQ